MSGGIFRVKCVYLTLLFHILSCQDPFMPENIYIYIFFKRNPWGILHSPQDLIILRVTIFFYQRELSSLLFLYQLSKFLELFE